MYFAILLLFFVICKALSRTRISINFKPHQLGWLKNWNK